MSQKHRIIFFGPPGSGKGTQSDRIKAEYNLAHISTGDALRAEIAAESEVGLRVKSIIEAGKLVDDGIIIEIVASAVSKTNDFNGFILDGVPRTIGQVEKLSELLGQMNQQITDVLYLNVSLEVLKERICGRLFHPGSGRTYHRTLRPPKQEMKDDVTGEPLIVRKDDTEEVFNERMDQYLSTFQPVLDYYKKQGILKEINGDALTIDEIYAKIKELLQ